MATRQRKTKQEIDLDFGLLSEAEQAEFQTQAMVELELRTRYGTSFKEFIKNVNPDYQFYRHNELLVDVLDRVAEGKLKRVMIWMPPRFGKSETASRMFPAYYMFRNPKYHYGLCSYSAELAYSLSRKARENYEQTGRVLSEEAASVKEWHTEMDGVFWSAGVGGSITGRGFHCGGIDDPLKDWEEAYSQLIRDKQWDWYRSTFYTSREPNAAIVIVQTRWHEDDLCGRLLRQESESPEHWHIVNFEAIKTDDPVRIPSTCTLEKDWRKVGQPLCPERYSLKELEKTRRAIGETAWRSLYQQRPVAEDGIIWKKAWFEGKTFEKLPVEIVNEAYDWDTAQTMKEGNAASAYVKGGVGSDGNIYVTDLDFKWLEFPEFVNWAKEKKDRPHYIEQKSSGQSLVQSLRKAGMYAQEVKVFGGDKVARTKVATPIVERGKVFIHKNIITRLLYDDRQGILKFPNGTHADLNDAFVQMLNRLRPFTKMVEQVQRKKYESYDDYMDKEVFSKIHEQFGQPKVLAWHQK